MFLCAQATTYPSIVRKRKIVSLVFPFVKCEMVNARRARSLCSCRSFRNSKQTKRQKKNKHFTPSKYSVEYYWCERSQWIVYISKIQCFHSDFLQTVFSSQLDRRWAKNLVNRETSSEFQIRKWQQQSEKTVCFDSTTTTTNDDNLNKSQVGVFRTISRCLLKLLIENDRSQVCNFVVLCAWVRECAGVYAICHHLNGNWCEWDQTLNSHFQFDEDNNSNFNWTD